MPPLDSPMPSFAAAVFFRVATPGPGVLSTAGAGSGLGFLAGLAYVCGQPLKQPRCR